MGQRGKVGPADLDQPEVAAAALGGDLIAGAEAEDGAGAGQADRLGAGKGGHGTEQ
jgi:hypothetical protein